MTPLRKGSCLSAYQPHRIIQTDEATHLTVLQGVATTLGGNTADVDSCQFDFTAALNDVPTFLATARVLEMVGVDA